MNLRTNGNSVMTPKNQSTMLKTSPRQYAGANGSLKLTPKEVASFHNSKGNSLGVTKGKKSPASNTSFKGASKNTPRSTATTTRTLNKK